MHGCCLLEQYLTHPFLHPPSVPPHRESLRCAALLGALTMLLRVSTQAGQPCVESVAYEG